MKSPINNLSKTLQRLNLGFMAQNYEVMATDAAREQLTHVEYLAMLVEGEATGRYERSVKRRIRNAHLPAIKTLDQFDWNWPKEINRAQIKDLFNLRFIQSNTNAVFIGGVGLGKTHLALSLAYTACLHDIPTLFASAVEIINNLSAAQAVHNLSKALKTYTTPRLLVIDELGYLPMDKRGADLLFQVISARYEHSSTVITANSIYKKWVRIFNNDAIITSAILDRLIHHCETTVIKGLSYRMREQTNTAN